MIFIKKLTNKNAISLKSSDEITIKYEKFLKT